MKKFLARSILSIVIASSVGVVHSAVLEEVIVTAQQRAESLQDVPVSVAAVTAEKMSDAGVVDLQGLSEYVPNFSINETGISTTITIRGISSGINPGFEQSVGMYNDGLFYGRGQLARVPMMDMARVEVLRGTQSILFGKNSIAGAVSQITAKPTDEFEGSITALYEPDHGEEDLRLVLSGPLTDNLSGRLAVLTRDMDGYVKNAVNGQDEQQESEDVIRASLRWDINADVTADLKVSRSTFDVVGRNLEVYNSIGTPDHITVLNALQAFQVDAELNYIGDNNGHYSNNEVNNTTLGVSWDLEGFTLTSTTGYVDYEFQENCDCDFTGAAVFDTTGEEEYSQFSQEFRITSDIGGDVDYIAGIFFQSTELEYSDKIILPDPTVITAALVGAGAGALAPLAAGSSTNREFNQDGDIWSLFAQATWSIADDMRLTFGGRYSQENKDADRLQQHVSSVGSPFMGATLPTGIATDPYNLLYGIFAIEPYEKITGKIDDDSFTPVVTLEWDVSEDAMAYATWTKGNKSGGFDARSNGHPDATVVNAVNPLNGASITGSWEFDREEASSIELGSKMSLADGAAELSMAFYMTEYTDLQVSQFDGTLGFNVTNAGEATVQGFEVDGRWAATDQLTLTGSAAYLDFKYDKFPNSQCYFGQVPNAPDFPGLCDVAGERKEYTPEFQANIGAAWSDTVADNLVLDASIDLNYMGDYIYSPNLDPRTEQEAYTLVNARVALSNAEGDWEFALIGRNLTDETVINFGGNTPLGGTLTGGAGNSYYAFVNRPRNVALQARYMF
jgi:outer membrane receptor protein involved in Fe transport